DLGGTERDRQIWRLFRGGAEASGIVDDGLYPHFTGELEWGVDSSLGVRVEYGEDAVGFFIVIVAGMWDGWSFYGSRLGGDWARGKQSSHSRGRRSSKCSATSVASRRHPPA